MSASCRHTTEPRQNSIPVVSTTDTYFDNPSRTRSQLHPVAGVGKGSVSARFQQIPQSRMFLIPLSRRMLHAPHPRIPDTQPRGCSPFSSSGDLTNLFILVYYNCRGDASHRRITAIAEGWPQVFGPSLPSASPLARASLTAFMTFDGHRRGRPPGICCSRLLFSFL